MVGKAESHKALPRNDNIIMTDTITTIVLLVVACPKQGLGMLPRCFHRHDVARIVAVGQLVVMSSLEVFIGGVVL